jgi:hypothetical protein
LNQNGIQTRTDLVAVEINSFAQLITEIEQRQLGEFYTSVSIVLTPDNYSNNSEIVGSAVWNLVDIIIKTKKLPNSDALRIILFNSIVNSINISRKSYFGLASNSFTHTNGVSYSFFLVKLQLIRDDQGNLRNIYHFWLLKPEAMKLFDNLLKNITSPRIG